jgi:DNA-binding MarR family transcriptional regulator
MDDGIKLGNFVCFSVYSAGHAFNRAYKPLLDPLGLTYPQYLVMVTLWEQDQQTVGQISEKLHLETNTVTPLLKRLEAAGRLIRERDPKDERQVRIRLTPEGAALQDQAQHIPACILQASGQAVEALTRLSTELDILRDALVRNQAS